VQKTEYQHEEIQYTVHITAFCLGGPFFFLDTVYKCHSHRVRMKQGLFGDGGINGVMQIFPGPSLVITAARAGVCQPEACLFCTCFLFLFLNK